MTVIERIQRLARIMRMTPKENVCLARYCNKWWITGCIEENREIPFTSRCYSLSEALESAEGWFAPEIESEERSVQL